MSLTLLALWFASCVEMALFGLRKQINVDRFCYNLVNDVSGSRLNGESSTVSSILNQGFVAGTK